MLIRIGFLILLLEQVSPGETVGQYLTQQGRNAQAIDFNLGFLSSVPQFSERAETRMGARIGLSYELDPIPMLGLMTPLNLALLYSTKAVELRKTKWTFSQLQFQILAHHFIHPGLRWLEPALFLSPYYTTDLILSSASGRLSAETSLESRFSVDAGFALLITVSMVQARFYYAQNLIRQAESTQLVVSSFGADLLLPLSRKRKTP
jgi:hypothetical protein